jgi:hypothetical protein
VGASNWIAIGALAVAVLGYVSNRRALNTEQADRKAQLELLKRQVEAEAEQRETQGWADLVPIPVETRWLAKSAETRLDIVNVGAGTARAAYWFVRGEVPEDIVEKGRLDSLILPGGTQELKVHTSRSLDRELYFVARWTDARGAQESVPLPLAWKPPY